MGWGKEVSVKMDDDVSNKHEGETWESRKNSNYDPAEGGWWTGRKMLQLNRQIEKGEGLKKTDSWVKNEVK